MKRIAFLICLLSTPCFAAVWMVPEITPDPDITLYAGETMGIDFWIESDIDFYGAVEWVGVGELSEPIYPDFPIIILPDPPYYPGFLPDNMWPIFYAGTLYPAPYPYRFATTTYFAADEIGNATINLYDLGPTFSEFILIDSFDIVVIPEPFTWSLLALGALFIRRR